MDGKTEVKEIIIDDIDQVLNPGSTVIVPEKKPNLFSRPGNDMLFDNNDDPPPPQMTEGEKAAKIASGELNPDGTLKVPVSKLESIEDILDDKSGKSGRQKLDKNGLVELTNKLIEKKFLLPFDDEKPIADYSLQDFMDLFEENNKQKEQDLQDKVAKSFFESLPEEMSYAAQYLQKGGQDMKSLFRALAAVEEVKELDPSQEGDDETIVRSYLQATNFGTADEIQEEITQWKDHGELSNKASKFKPKLEAMHSQMMEAKMQQLDRARTLRANQQKQYTDDIYKILEPAELNGLKLDKKVQSMLFSGLTQANYPSATGNQTNLLGHLLEKYQFVEPNHSLIAEALWLLADPDGYKNKIKEGAAAGAVQRTVKQLKTAEAGKTVSSVIDDEGEPGRKPVIGKIPRPGNFFKRQ